MNIYITNVGISARQVIINIDIINVDILCEVNYYEYLYNKCRYKCETRL